MITPCFRIAFEMRTISSCGFTVPLSCKDVADSVHRWAQAGWSTHGVLESHDASRCAVNVIAKDDVIFDVLKGEMMPILRPDSNRVGLTVERSATGLVDVCTSRSASV